MKAAERRLKRLRDWSLIINTYLNKRDREICINLLGKGLSIEKVFEAVGLSEEERQLKKDRLWNNIIIAFDNKKTDMYVFFKTVLDEKSSEIALKLINMIRTLTWQLDLSKKDISDVTGLSEEQVEEIAKMSE